MSIVTMTGVVPGLDMNGGIGETLRSAGWTVVRIDLTDSRQALVDVHQQLRLSGERPSCFSILASQLRNVTAATALVVSGESQTYEGDALMDVVLRRAADPNGMPFIVVHTS